MFTKHTPIILATAIAFGCSEGAVAPTARSDSPTLRANSTAQPIHSARVGTPDICAALGRKPGCDANFSLNALQSASGSTGQWQDQFARDATLGGIGIHVAVNCLNVIGNQAWISGVITSSRVPGVVGLDAVTTVVDNGKTGPDSISVSFIGTGIDCNAAPGIGFLPLFPAPQGQVVVK